MEKSQEQILAEEKANAIIDSCTVCEHIMNAKSFIELFLKTFNDENVYNELLIKLETKKNQINCYE